MTIAIYVLPVLPFVPRTSADLKFSVIDRVGEPLVCTGWGMPNPRFNPYGEYPRIVADVPTYLAILRREHLPPTPLASYQIVVVYQDWLKLSAVRLDWRGGYYDFEMFPGTGPSAGLRTEKVGKVDLFGRVADVHDGSGLGACPICLIGNSPIATPTGAVAVSRITVGMHVWSAAPDGRRVDAVVVATRSRLDAPGSELVHIALADGREITASPAHRLGDGRPLGTLKRGDQIDGVPITSVKAVEDSLGRTYDLLPSGETGTYWVDGILVQSTLGNRSAS